MTGRAILGVSRAADAGLRDMPAPVVVQVQGGLAALVVDAAAAPDKAGRVALAAVVARRLQAFAPVTLGAATAEGVERWLAARSHGLSVALTRVAGCDEWIATLSAAPPRQPLVAVEPGAANWLRSRAIGARTALDARAEAEAALRALAESLAPIARATRVVGFRDERGVGADLAILLPRERADALRAVLAVMPDQPPLSGPWPAFSFCRTESALS